MGIGKFILVEIGYIIYYAIPYLDIDILGALDGTLGLPLSWMPLVEPIDMTKLSPIKNILLICLFVIPYVDLEGLKALRLHKQSKFFRFSTKQARKGKKMANKKTGKRAKKAGKWTKKKGKKKAKNKAEKKKKELKNEARSNNKNNRNKKRPMTDGGKRENKKVTRRDPLRADGGSSGSKISLGSIPFKKIGIAVGGVLGLFIFLVVVASITGGSGGYLGLFGDMISGPASSVRESAFFPGEEIAYQLKRGAATLACFGGEQGAGCFTEKVLLNSTKKPGSEDVGETYKLRITGPTVAGSRDIAFKEPDSKIPVDFSVKNSRHGIKGINAKNVTYRVKISHTGVLTDETACQTGWRELNKFGEEAEDKLDNPERNNMILPGESVSPLNYRGEDRLSLRECGMMKAVALAPYRAEVQVKYDYSALSFLQIEAKAKSEVDQRGRLRSKTPDTPVETVIKTPQSPLVYEEVGEENIALPSTFRVTIRSDENRGFGNSDGGFRVYPEEFSLSDSELTVHNDGECDGLKKTGENQYEFTEEVIDRIESRQERGLWFNSRAPTASCNFELKNPEEISETGETLTMTAQANYTLKTRDEDRNFNMRNGACSRVNCPMVVPLNMSNLKNSNVLKLDLDEDDPLDYENSNWEEGDYWEKEYALCRGRQDAQEGCSWVKSYDIEDRRELETINEKKKRKIEEGDFAVAMDGAPDQGDNVFTCHAEEASISDTDVISVDREALREVFDTSSSAFNYTEGGSWEYVEEYDPASCS
jgi:hypothetical protein